MYTTYVELPSVQFRLFICYSDGMFSNSLIQDKEVLYLLRSWQSDPHQWLASRKIRSVEELETLPAGTKLKTSHHRSPGGKRRGKRKR